MKGFSVLLESDLDITPSFCLSLQAYLEDFYNFCKKMGGATAEVMCEALGVSVGFIVTQEKTVLL